MIAGEDDECCVTGLALTDMHAARSSQVELSQEQPNFDLQRLKMTQEK